MDNTRDHGIMKSSDDDSEGNHSPHKQRSSKRDSLFDGVFMNFDGSEFEDGESWRSVFDEQGPSTAGETEDENRVLVNASVSTSNKTDSSDKHPNLNQDHTALSFLGTIGSSDGGGTTKASFRASNEALRFASQTTEGRWPNPTPLSNLSRRAWHDDVLDGPHRERMMQDM
jgi:hypothetical protein